MRLPCSGRRGFLKSALAAGSLSLWGRSAGGASRPSDDVVDRIAAFLEGTRQADGGYGWGDQPRSHLTPTYGAVGCYFLLGRTPPRSQEVAQFIRTHHPFDLKKLARPMKSYEYEQIQSLRWLNADADFLLPVVQQWTTPLQYNRRYELHGYPVFKYEAAVFWCRALLGLPVADAPPALVAYLDSRRRDNGSFNNTPAADGSDGHVMNTWWGLAALETLGRAGEQRERTVQWLQGCQRDEGGFSWQPRPPMADVQDVAHTHAAVLALELLDAQPVDTDACRQQLLSLWNPDGGFGARRGWDSNPLTTFHALDSLRALGGWDALSVPQPQPARPRRPALPDDLQVYSAVVEAHGSGSPADAVQLARALKLHLWGAKNAKPGWIEAAQTIAQQSGTPVHFFQADEEYGTFVDVDGQGTYSHTSDIVAPADAMIGPSLAGEPVSWETFRRRRWQPLQQAGGRLVWQFGENEVLTRLYMDDSLQRGGYAAISTFHFGNPDFTNSSGFLKQYRGQIPYIAIHDAHGSEPWWWSDLLTGYRTLFLAKQPTWEGWLQALDNNWVVAVRHDAVSGYETWMHGGNQHVVDFVNRHQQAWRWWDNPSIERPWAAVVAITPDDSLETGRPESGVAIRIRRQWENTAQGQPKTPRAELVRLLVDGKPVQTQCKTVGPTARPSDEYYVHIIDQPIAGEHTATAVLRRIDTGAEVQQTIRFSG